MKRNNPPKKLIYLTGPEAKALRKELYKKQRGICPILNRPMKFKDCVLDHKHKKKKQKAGPNGRGLVRGVIHNQANSLEGIIAKKFKRQGVHKYTTLPDYLRRLADYLEKPTLPPIYVHPDERPKPKKLTKTEYKRIKKYYFEIYPRRRKFPKYPYKGKMSKKWAKLLKIVNKIHFK